MKQLNANQTQYKGGILQQLFPYVAGQSLDTLLASLNSSLTPPLGVDASNPASLVVNVNAISIANPESDRNNSSPFINNVLPTFTGGTVTFPASSGGNITASTGGTFPLVVPSGNYVQVVLALDSNGSIQVSVGIPNAVLASALVPSPIQGTLPFCYVTVQNIGGVIQNITQSNIYQFVGGGGATGSGGLINYISANPNAESATTGWVVYQNTAANIPITGTGGSPVGLTLTRSTVNPLRGMGSFLLTQANSTNVQGQGASFNFTIDNADQAKILEVSFDYNASSTFVTSDGITSPLNDGTTSTNAGNSDVEAFIYDVTNAILLPVLPEVITAKGSNNFSFAGFVQTSVNSTSYRLILHCATANANATGWQFKFDNVFVGPQVLGVGASSLRPTQTILTSGSGTYTPPSGVTYVKIRMVGGGGGGGGGTVSPGTGAGGTGGTTTFGTSFLSANGGNGGSSDEPGGSGGSASALPGGLAGGFSFQGSGGGPGGNFTGSGSGGASPFGGSGFGAGSPSTSGGSAAPNTGAGGGGGSNNPGSAFTGSGGGSGNYIEATINNPASSYAYSVGAAGGGGGGNGGGGSGGNGGSGIIIIDEYYSNSESSVGITSALPTIVETIDTSLYTLPNTINSWSLVSSGWNIVIPTTGYWKLSYKTGVLIQGGSGQPNAAVALSTSLTPGTNLIDGNIVNTVTAPNINLAGASLQTKPLYLTAGTTIYMHASIWQYITASSVTSFQIVNNAPGEASAGEQPSYIRAELVPNFASENSASVSVNASYGCSTNAPIAIGITAIPFDTFDYDTHNAFNIGTSLYTVPVSGKYDVASLATIQMSLSAGDGVQIVLFKNGSAYRELGGITASVTGSADYRLTGTTGVACVAGDTLQVAISASSTGSLIGGVMANHFSVNRIGN